MAKIAVEVEQALAVRAATGAPGRATATLIASGPGWRAEDIICTSGPQDRSFEERHSAVSIAIVAAGTFQYRSADHRELMTPGALLLGNMEQCFECGHEHGSGDRCLSFHYAADYFERVAADAGARTASRPFPVPRVPALRDLAGIVAKACGGLATYAAAPRTALWWEELGVHLAVQALTANGIASVSKAVIPGAVARVTDVIRFIERQPQLNHSLASMAEQARMSPFHFLRTFERLTGLTPHQYIVRLRLREAAVRIAAEPAKILDIALDSGFGDVSNFNRMFRSEFGASPREYRRESARDVSPV